MHALAYSFIGFQTLYIATRWNPIYWNTACLIVNSGATDPENGGSTDYSKIAKALGDILNNGIKISLPDINKSGYGFKPDVENNQIIYGLKAMLNVGDDIIDATIQNRPYESPKDYLNKVNPNKQAMISLIKGGAFDNMMDRNECMVWYIWETCEKKQRLTLQNLGGLAKYKLLPNDTEEQIMANRVYEFNRYIKAKCLQKDKKTVDLDVRALEFLAELGEAPFSTIGEWDKIYQKWMSVFRNWINSDKENILKKFNDKIFTEDWDKYSSTNISAGEMEAICFYYHEHELSKVNFKLYNLVNFFDLPENPVVEKTFRKGGKDINIFKISSICGTCIAKNKDKSTVSLLTVDGVVTVKFRKEYFALFDKQISIRGADGKKHVIEKSWFNRGNMIIVQGIRSEDNFVSKKYSSTVGHQLYKIEKVNSDGTLALRDARAAGEVEESED